MPDEVTIPWTPEKPLDAHPAAAIFPMLSDAELYELAKSITGFGLREKIGIIYIDEIPVVLDGRNRLEAMRRIGVKDAVILDEFTEVLDLEELRATPEEYVLLANIERRNLTQPQRRQLAGKLAVMLAERQKDLPKSEQTDTLSEAAAKAGVSRRTAATAKQQVLIDAGAKPPKKTPARKKAAKGFSFADLNKTVEKAINMLNRSGHHAALDQLRRLKTHGETIVALAESKIDFVEKKEKESAAKIAAAKKK